MNVEDLLFTLAITKVKGIGPITAKKLIDKFGTAKGVFSASKEDLLKQRASEQVIKNIGLTSVLKEAEIEVKNIQEQNITPLFFKSNNYPTLLKQCDDAPLILFLKGNSIDNWQNRNVISIVGTRNPTNRGQDFCNEFISALKPYNPIIVSGLAYGVDICAHKAALQNGLETFAILGHGLNHLYPAQHEKEAKKILEQGGLISEYWTESKIEREKFVQRNRLVAGISQAVIVIESAIKGGSMSTVNFANDYNRDVFAIPGRITDAMSQGCNELIRSHRAQLLTNAEEFIAALNWDLVKKETKSIQPKLFLNLNEEEQSIYDFLISKEKELLDVIAIECEIPIYKVSTILLQLELQGLVRPLPGKYFEIIP